MKVSTMRGLMMSMLAVLLLPMASGAQTAPGDRYLCYKAGPLKGQPKFSSVQKTLEDQFWASVANVNGFASLCNPTLPAQHSSVHQVGYLTALVKEKPAQKFVKSTHTAFDQFGSHPLMVVRPLEVRAPSAKVVGGGGTPTVNTTGVDHFQCYRAALPRHTPKLAPIPVSITDEFGSLELTLTRMTKLCAPVNKAGEDATAPQHAGHLVCYQAKLPKGVKFPATTVSVNNTNFGPAVLVARSVSELCVPAFKDVVPSPTPTARPTPTPTPTHTPSPTRTPTPTPMHTPTPTPLRGGFPATFCDGFVSCPSGQSCNLALHRCEFACESSECITNTQICCPGGAGACCDRATQICNDLQTDCASPNCGSGEAYVPKGGVCCQNADICPNKFTGATCCTADQKCQLDESGNGICVWVTSCVPDDVGQALCPNGGACNPSTHTCQFDCGTTSCDAGTQVCCPGGPGVCCEMPQTCNDLQTGCASAPCSALETFVPQSNICCDNDLVCPNQLAGETCCTSDQQCQLDGSGNGVCVPRQ